MQRTETIFLICRVAGEPAWALFRGGKRLVGDEESAAPMPMRTLLKELCAAPAPNDLVTTGITGVAMTANESCPYSGLKFDPRDRAVQSRPWVPCLASITQYGLPARLDDESARRLAPSIHAALTKMYGGEVPPAQEWTPRYRRALANELLLKAAIRSGASGRDDSPHLTAWLTMSALEVLHGGEQSAAEVLRAVA
jgi:hypothetical protein